MTPYDRNILILLVLAVDLLLESARLILVRKPKGPESRP